MNTITIELSDQALADAQMTVQLKLRAQWKDAQGARKG